MYMRPKLGCCGGSAVGFGQSAESNELSPIIPTVVNVPPSSTPYPWGKLFVTSVLAGLTLHFLTRRRG